MTPREIAAAWHAQARSRVTSEAFQLGYDLHLQWPGADPVDVSPAANALQVVAHYAETGDNIGDAPLADFLESAGMALVGEGISKATPWGAAWLTAQARLALDSGEPVPSQGLAILAGVSASTVARLVASGELAGTGDELKPGGRLVEHADAKRWLTNRTK